LALRDKEVPRRPQKAGAKRRELIKKKGAATKLVGLQGRCHHDGRARSEEMEEIGGIGGSWRKGRTIGGNLGKNMG